MAKGKKERKDWMAELGARLAELLENGIAPWEQPWVGGGAPTSLATGKPYEGTNAVFLNAIAVINGYTSNRWLTFNRAKQLGGNIRKGEKGSPVVWYEVKQKRDRETGEPIPDEFYVVSGGSWVWNLDQTENIDRDTLPEVEAQDPPQSVSEVWFGMPDRPRVEIYGTSAHYNVSSKIVTVPPPAAFKTEGAFYATLWHEVAHWWTFVHMPADVGTRKELEKYSFGELVAEMTAAIMMHKTGLTFDLERSADYIRGWMTPIKSDPKLFTRAWKAATEAAAWMLAESAQEPCDSVQAA